MESIGRSPREGKTGKGLSMFGFALCLLCALSFAFVLPEFAPISAEGAPRVVTKTPDGKKTVRRTRLHRKKTVKRRAVSLFAGGQGTARSPWTIRTEAQLRAFAASVNGGRNYAGKHIRLTANVDLGGRAWAPIGFSRIGRTLAFSGVFDGNGRTISGLSLKHVGKEPVGLFGTLSGAYVYNLTVEDAEVNGVAEVGILAGAAQKSTVKNVSVSGSVAGSQNVGGLIGNAVECRLLNSEFIGKVKGAGASAGGIAGGAFGSILMHVSVSDSSIEGRENVGAMAGTFQAGLLQNVGVERCVVTGTENVGGVAGAAAGPIQFQSVAFDGNVEGVENVGGVLGLNAQGTVKDASVQGNVRGTNQVGGAFGLWRGGTALRCISTASVNGRANVGGVAGQMEKGLLDRCTSDEEVRGGDIVGGLIGRYVGGRYTNCQPSTSVHTGLKGGREIGNESER